MLLRAAPHIFIPFALLYAIFSFFFVILWKGDLEVLVQCGFRFNVAPYYIVAPCVYKASVKRSSFCQCIVEEGLLCERARVMYQAMQFSARDVIVVILS